MSSAVSSGADHEEAVDAAVRRVWLTACSICSRSSVEAVQDFLSRPRPKGEEASAGA